MTQFLLLLHKIVGFKLVVILLSAATVGAVVFQASNVLKVHALNVRIEVKATPPGITQIIDRSGEPPLGIVNPEGNQTIPFTIDSDSDSGTDSPGDNPPPENGPTTQGGNESTSQDENNTIPPGIDKIIEKTGKPPPGLVRLGGGAGKVLYINTPIEFGQVFPGETLTQHFIVGLQGVTEPGIGPPWWGAPEEYDYVEYKITVQAVSGSSLLDLSDYITVIKDDSESPETEPDETAYAPGDKVAEGTLDDNATDTEDKWFVTLDQAPDITGDYECEIVVEVITTTPPS